MSFHISISRPNASVDVWVQVDSNKVSNGAFIPTIEVLTKSCQRSSSYLQSDTSSHQQKPRNQDRQLLGPVIEKLLSEKNCLYQYLGFNWSDHEACHPQRTSVLSDTPPSWQTSTNPTVKWGRAKADFGKLSLHLAIAFPSSATAKPPWLTEFGLPKSLEAALNLVHERTYCVSEEERILHSTCNLAKKKTNYPPLPPWNRITLKTIVCGSHSWTFFYEKNRMDVVREGLGQSENVCVIPVRDCEHPSCEPHNELVAHFLWIKWYKWISWEPVKKLVNGKSWSWVWL